MDKYKIKDLAKRLQKEKTTELQNKMLFMWIKQEVISLQEHNELVKLILYGVGGTLDFDKLRKQFDDILDTFDEQKISDWLDKKS